MPQRQRTRTILGGPQGDDAKIVIKKMTVGEAKTLQSRFQEILASGDDNTETINSESNALLAEHILEWNWVDDDDDPLPQPKGNPEVFDQLLVDEIQFLVGALGGAVDDQKKGKSGGA